MPFNVQCNSLNPFLGVRRAACRQHATVALLRTPLRPACALPPACLYIGAWHFFAWQAAREIAASLPAAEMHTVEGGYHDLLSGAEVQQYVAGMAGWISRNCSMLN